VEVVSGALGVLLAVRPLAALVLVALSAGLPGCGETCATFHCEPCVDETCELTCVEPDDEDIAYSCLWPCSDGADCTLGCEGPDCNLDCRASDCACDGCDAHCVDGASCRISGSSKVGCDGADCEMECGAQCLHECTNGSTCTTRCVDGGEFADEAKCRMSCDATSSCHLECRGQCALCCNGSEDCVLDCPDGATSCLDGSLVCGVECGEPFVFPLSDTEEVCPKFTDQWLE
jgi:hypothetical protein